MSEGFKSVFAFALVMGVAIVAAIGIRKSFSDQETSDKNCSPYVKVIAFRDESGLHSVCLNAEGKYVIKP
jgi:hypothetical protein